MRLYSGRKLCNGWPTSLIPHNMDLLGMRRIVGSGGLYGTENTSFLRCRVTERTAKQSIEPTIGGARAPAARRFKPLKLSPKKLQYAGSIREVVHDIPQFWVHGSARNL